MPETEWDWRKDSIDLSAYAGQNILVRIESTNRKGNNIYIDDLKIFSGNQEPTFVTELDREVSIYPNPTSNILNIEVSDKIESINGLRVLDVLGKEIQVNFSSNQSRFILSTENLKPGLYFLQLDVEQGNVVKRFIKH